MPIEQPTSVENIGTFNSLEYVLLRGRFTGETRLGRFAVPYEIETPKNPTEGSRTFVFEPPHAADGLIGRDVLLGREFLLSRSFSYAAVGFSNVFRRILESAPRFSPVIGNKAISVIPRGGPGEISDYEILHKFALELKENARASVGEVERLYAIGFSDSGNVLHEVYKLFGHKLFDLSFACTTAKKPIKRKGSKLMVVFSAESHLNVDEVVDPPSPNYRWYGVAGAAHRTDRQVSDAKLKAEASAPSTQGTTPINWVPFIRALFVAGDEWVRNGTPPPPSSVLTDLPK